MAQLSSNSQGTINIDGGATQSSLLSVLNAVGYMGLMTTAIKEANKDKDKKDKKNEKEDDDSSEGSNDSGNDDTQDSEEESVDVEWKHEDQNQIKGKTQDKLTGRNPKRLKPSPPDKQKKSPSSEQREVNISAKDNLSVAIQIGDYRIKDKYANLPKRFGDIPEREKQALGIAMIGETPSQNVSIKIEDEFGRQSEFSADIEKNEGWKVVGEPSECLSAQQMQQEISRQQGEGAKKIKKVMKEIYPEEGPQMFSGKNLVIFTDSDEVIVFDRNRGIVRDAVRLDTIGNQGQQAVRDAVREAAGKFNINGSASQGIASKPKIHQQRQLTP